MEKRIPRARCAVRPKYLKDATRSKTEDKKLSFTRSQPRKKFLQRPWKSTAKKINTVWWFGWWALDTSKLNPRKDGMTNLMLKSLGKKYIAIIGSLEEQKEDI